MILSIWRRRIFIITLALTSGSAIFAARLTYDRFVQNRSEGALMWSELHGSAAVPYALALYAFLIGHIWVPFGLVWLSGGKGRWDPRLAVVLGFMACSLLLGHWTRNGFAW